MNGGFTLKARLLAGRNNTAPPTFTTYSSVVTKERVRLEILIVGLNDLHICACDIGN